MEFAFVSAYYPLERWMMTDVVMIWIGTWVTFPEFNYESIDFTAFSVEISDGNVVAFLLTTDIHTTLCWEIYIHFNFLFNLT